MKVIGWLVRKDLGVFFADRNGALMTFAVPVLLASLIGMLFAGREKAGTVDLLVVDEDQGAAAKALVAALDREAALAVHEATAAEARARVAAGKASVALVLPRGVGAALTPSHLFMGEPFGATLWFDPSREVEAELVAGLFQKVQMEEAAKGLADPAGRVKLFEDLRGTSRGAWSLLLEQALSLSQREAAGPADGAGMKPPLALDKQPVIAAGPAEGYNSYAHSFAGMLCMFLLFLSQDMAKGLLEERRTGVLLRTRLARVRPIVPLVAMAGATTVLGLILSAAVYAVGIVVFGIEVHGGALALGAVLVAQALFAGGFAVLLAGIGRSERQVQAWGMAAILLMSFVGGAWYPRFMMPDWLQSVATALPTSWATDGLAASTWRGLPLSAALVPALVLVCFAAAATAIGAWRFRWEP